MEDCLFCRIAAGQLPAARVYEDENCVAFDDIAPQAPVHVLVVHKTHTANVLQAADHPGMMETLFAAVAHVVRIKGLQHSGFRCIINTGGDAQQSVGHLHIHVLGGRELPAQMA